LLRKDQERTCFVKASARGRRGFPSKHYLSGELVLLGTILASHLKKEEDRGKRQKREKEVVKNGFLFVYLDAKQEGEYRADHQVI